MNKFKFIPSTNGAISHLPFFDDFFTFLMFVIAHPESFDLIYLFKKFILLKANKSIGIFIDK